MCGVVGYYTKEKTSDEIFLLSKLIEQSKIRGLHSFGISYLEQGKIITKKQDKLDVSNLLADFINSSSTKLIFHNRYSTSGDYKMPINNQPIVVDNKALVMNGVLTMSDKETYEKEFKVKCISDNDAEIFLRKNQPIIDTLQENPHASFAGIYLSPEEFYMIRNANRPLYYFIYNKAIFVASTKDIVRRVGFEGEIKEVPMMKKVSL